jgi:phosphate transport system protein
MKKILFIGPENKLCTQMAEAFVKIHGKGRLEAFSAGLASGAKISPKAVEAMMEKGYDLSTHHSKNITEFKGTYFDIIVSFLSEKTETGLSYGKFISWELPDPAKMERENFRAVCDQIETKVKDLINKQIFVTHLQEELNNLKNDLSEMWTLVIHQLIKSKEALVSFNKDLAREVVINEKRVNGLELKIDRDCENIFALFNPVAIDLRFVLAVLKINNNLERNGDIAEGISRFIINNQNPFTADLLEKTRVVKMFEVSQAMLTDVLIAFEKEDPVLARSVFGADEILDEINLKANQVIAEYVRSNPDTIEQALYILSTIRKLERIGDQTKNIAEEIIFFIEAKVLKHKNKGEGKN